MQQGKPFGIEGVKPKINFSKVHEHVHHVIKTIAPHDSVERFEKLGVKVLKAQAQFINPRTIKADGTLIRAKRIVIATGSSPFIPPIDGLEKVSYLTNETIFGLKELPMHLIIIGGGPIGIEMAQAFVRLGSKVTVLEGMKILPKDDSEMVDLLHKRLLEEGVDVQENATVLKISQQAKKIKVECELAGKKQEFQGTHLLLAVGRRPDLAELNLHAGDIQFSSKGIWVDRHLQTSNKYVYAMGDAVGSYQFTHVATHHGEIVLRNILFKLPAKIQKNHHIPWVTYTDPELAHIGMTEHMAKDQGLRHKVLRFDFKEIDRAQAERILEGGIKVITSSRGHILGATIIGPHAGELIQPWCLAMQQNLKIGAMAKMIVPYPTLGEINKRVSGSFFAPLLFNNRIKRIVRFLMRWS
jgi:pyruvate/2-oxoglutarate dehydrogenase complex dihydrolipoamide dehydrogenase (E3) component